MASQQQQQQAGGPMSQPGLQQPASLQQQQQQLSQQQDFDPVHRFKMLIPQLKESLQVRAKNWHRKCPKHLVTIAEVGLTSWRYCSPTKYMQQRALNVSLYFSFSEFNEDCVPEFGPQHVNRQRHVSCLFGEGRRYNSGPEGRCFCQPGLQETF